MLSENQESILVQLAFKKLLKDTILPHPSKPSVIENGEDNGHPNSEMTCTTNTLDEMKMTYMTNIK